ncbi:FAD:protein FMN transferase ApbE [Alteromonas aestuariivivens]|uniref:FAD:protein FMN transferase n=2 Tax=Alteromonas aestuariivivens TaxID=1938339 RepID=A0A3D8M4L4_9ALTE|nr:FAD:protein FMN transferase ApbE [Alteromonas aestuariivivens]
MHQFRMAFLFAIVFVAGCGQPDTPVIHLSGPTMGTTYNIKYVVEQGQPIADLQSQVDARLVEINKLMSTYDTTSELSRFNQYRYTNPFPVSAQTRAVVQEALRLGQLSHQVLDVTVGPLVNLWGFGPTKRPEKIPTQDQIEAVRGYVGLDKLAVDDNALVKSHPMLYVDLSTIAKGYGVDQVAEVLEANGLHDYLVEIGGEMRVKGVRGDGQAWLIAIEKPVSDQRAVQKVVSIGTNAIATSGDYRNFYEQDGVRYSHLIDPRTGMPIQHNVVSVTVVHPSSMTADGLATAFNVMGWEDGIALAEQQELAVFMIRKTGDGFEEYASPEFEAQVEVHN